MSCSQGLTGFQNLLGLTPLLREPCGVPIPGFSEAYHQPALRRHFRIRPPHEGPRLATGTYQQIAANDGAHYETCTEGGGYGGVEVLRDEMIDDGAKCM